MQNDPIEISGLNRIQGKLQSILGGFARCENGATAIEYGLICSLIFMAIVVSGRRIAERAHACAGLFPYYVAAGATFAVAFQAVVNIAVATASAPNKGVSLPFVSVGGSSLVTAFASIGLLVNVSRHVAEQEGGDPWGS